MEENHYNCIYMYTNKINGKRYVGKAQDFNERHKQHINAMKNKNNNEYDRLIQRAFRKYGLENFEVEILKENLTKDEMNYWEDYYIETFDLYAKNGKGYNLAKGGIGGNLIEGKTEEERKEIRQKQSENHADFSGEKHPMYGKHHTEEAKRKISENHANNKGENHPCYGKHHSEETKKKISENHADFSGEKHPLAKRVAQYDKQGNLIKIWDYAKQATEELEINCSNIISCCKFWEMNCNKEEWHKTHKGNPNKSAYGYIWRYAEELE